LRSGQIVYNASGEAIGEITSGTFSPTLQQGIALARISVADQQTCYIDRRGKKILLSIIKPPFVRFGKQQF
jgi:aminomethyltransferase